MTQQNAPQPSPISAEQRAHYEALADAAVERYRRATQSVASATDEINEAIDEWYSANYPFGVRLRHQERRALAEHLARRLVK